MVSSDGGGLDSASIFVMSTGAEINPATITFIRVPDLDFSPTGSISLSGSAEHFVGISKTIDFGWSIRGVFSKEFSSDWKIGEGEYQWYRVEGVCGQMKCDTSGLLHPDCKNMTIMTVVAARNLDELCYTLKNPVVNPELEVRIKSIKKYSRTPARTPAGECNILEDQEFCQIAECLDYCLDEDVRQKMSFSMRVIESTKLVEMSGGVFVYGQSQTNKHKAYDPLFPVIGLSGLSYARPIFKPHSSNGVFVFGSASIVSNSYNFDPSSGTIQTGGYARTCSPSRIYEDMLGGVDLFGGCGVFYSPRSSGGLAASGSAETFFAFRFGSLGKIELEGRIADYTSPKYRYGCSGSAKMSGSASFNFDDIGMIPVTFGMGMSAFDFASDSSVPTQISNLTISDGSVSPSCGCGPVSFLLDLQHNLDKSSYMSAFLTRSNKSLDKVLKLRYRSSDTSWRYAGNILGFGRDGVSREEMSIFSSLSCSSGFWRFSFSVSTHNFSTGDRLATKLILDMPSDLICSDNNISTRIELDINSGDFQLQTGRMISVVDPARTQSSNPASRSVDVFVDGVFGDKRVYYDNIGLFKNSYWTSYPVKMTINPASSTVMPKMDTSRIF